MARRVLVVDDEPSIVHLVESALRLSGYETASAADGRGAVEAVAAFRPDVVVLDVMLPDVDGFTVLRRLRDGGSPVPVIFLTARDRTTDLLHGLNIGGGDYLVKPFAVAELVARVALLMRHSGGADPVPTDRFRFLDLEIDDEAHRVTRAGAAVSLSPTEYKLLRFLVLNPNRVLTRAEILDAVWSYDFEGSSAVVDTFISYLRRKIDHVEPRLIHTVRGVGFCLRAG